MVLSNFKVAHHWAAFYWPSTFGISSIALNVFAQEEKYVASVTFIFEKFANKRAAITTSFLGLTLFFFSILEHTIKEKSNNCDYIFYLQVFTVIRMVLSESDESKNIVLKDIWLSTS